jgi:hypothetical protein
LLVRVQPEGQLASELASPACLQIYCSFALRARCINASPARGANLKDVFAAANGLVAC